MTFFYGLRYQTLMTLRDLTVNEQAQISKLTNVEEKTLLRLKELGISEGRKITCIKRAPFGGPSIYQTSDSVFSLDKNLAQAVGIQK